MRVRARIEPASGDGRADASTRVFIDIEDDGPGMSPEVMSKIFRPFFTKKPRGTGLGLSIAQKLIRENNGRIWVRSSLGRGSVFSVEVPGALT